MKATILKSVMGVVLAVAGVFNANLNAQSFVTNEVMTGEIVTSKMIYRHEGDFLFRHMKYDFTYNEVGQVTGKEVSKWDAKQESWLPYYRMTISYIENRVTVDYGKWNSKENAYTLAQERSTYAFDVFSNPVVFQGYKWSNASSDWVMIDEVALGDGEPLYLSGIR